MRISSKLMKVSIFILILVLTKFTTFGQSECYCSPQIDLLFDDCVEQGKPVDIGFVIYSSLLSNNTEAWVKVYAGSDVVLDKSVVFTEKGVYTDLFNLIPSDDTRFMIEFYCDKDSCFTTYFETLKTIPAYTLTSKDISCYGSLNGEVQLLPDTDLSLVWESGEKKNFVTNMHYGTYNVTIENVNGCKETKQIILKEPEPLSIEPKSITVDDGNNINHYVQLEVTGGTGLYIFDWDQDGIGDMDDKSSIKCNISDTHNVMVMDQNGCWAQEGLSFEQGNIINYAPKDGKIYPDEHLENGAFKYNLYKALNRSFGDIDGDGLDGCLFDVEFLDSGNTINDPTNFITSTDMEISVIYKNASNIQGVSSLLLTSGFFLLQNNSSTACDYFDPILIQATTVGGAPLPPGGIFKAYERSTLEDYSSDVLSFDAVSSTWTWNPMFKPQIPVSPLRYILYYIIGTDTLQSQLNVVSPSGSVDILAGSVCGNGDLVQVLCSPADGILSGPGLFSSSITFPNSDQIIYFIDPKDLTPGQVYSFTYSIPQSTGTGGGLRCAAVISDTLRIFPFPSVQINQFDSQVCEKEEISLSSVVIPTSGNTSEVSYEWYFRSNNITTLIQNSSSSQLLIPEASVTGQYIVKATQSNGCMARDTGIVEVFELPRIDSRVLTSTNCFGVSNAIVDVVLQSGGSLGGYIFDWIGKETGIVRSGSFQANLPADSFFITVTTPPLNGAGLMCSILDTVVITSYPPIMIECIPPTDTLQCHGQRIARTIVINTPGTYEYRLGATGQWQSSNTFNNLGVDDPLMTFQDFKVFVRNNLGCIDSCEFSLYQPGILTCALGKTDLTCFQNGSGTATANITGGTAPFRYMWSTGFVEGPSVFTTSSVTGLSAGTYYLTVTDVNNCSSICSITINEPTPIVPNINPIDVCLDFDTQVMAAASGGTGTYTYLWNLVDAGTTMAVDTNLLGTTDDAIQDFTTWCLKPGVITVGIEIRDGNNCLTTTTTTLDVQSCFDLAIRKRVALPDKQYYPGDTVTFNIEVFNQGTVNALDVRISDILDENMSYTLSHNTAVQTGNSNDWIAGINDSLHTIIPRIDAGQKVILKVILSINTTTNQLFMVNTVRITSTTSEIPNGTSFRIKDDPIDEDEILPPFDTPPSKQPEKDDEICDNMNDILFPVECPLGDDPDDEDGEDYAIVSICQLHGRDYSDNQCVSSSTKIVGLVVNTPETRDQMDPTGNGDGIANGDTGNNVVSFHNTYLDAMKGTNAISGRIMFSNGNGGVNSSNGIVTGQGDLIVFTNQKVQVFGRLVALSGCSGVSTLTLEFLPELNITESPENTLVILDQEDVCFEVVVDNSLSVPFTIQWQQLINGVFVDIFGANGTEYCIDKATNDYDQRQYRIQTFATEDPNRTCATVSARAMLRIDSEPVLVCNDLVNVSLDDECEVLITPDMVLEDIRFEARIRIQLTNSQGQIIPNPITSAYIGQLINVSAIDIVNGNSCWGKLFIEDKLPPVINCPIDYTVSCANASFNPPVPTFEDACDPSATIEKIADVFVELDCNRTDGIIGRRTLTYIAKDKYGNVSKPCTFNVFYRSTTLDQIVWPINTSLSCRVAPSYPVWDINKNNYPDITEAGIPNVEGFNLATISPSGSILSISYCQINVTYSDELIQLCGNSYKIVRNWTALNWCNSTLVTHVQLIDVKDNDGPIVTCPIDQSFDIFTQDHTCTADFTVPAPIVISDCNATTWTVGYLLADANGQAPINGQYITENVIQVGTSYIIRDLPLGRTWLRYTVTDACDNFTYCFTEVTVFDKIKPTPICDEVTVVTLSLTGKALIYSETFDDGSHDNCSSVTFSARRLTSGCNSNGSTNESVNPFGPFVEFCCNDVGVDVMVELKVKDASGNENSCMVIVNVQDKIPPVITCPQHVTISCGADTSANVLGKPVFSTSPLSTAYYNDNCPDLKLTWQNRGTISDCGQGVITRTFTVTDKAGNRASCEQRITVRNTNPYNGPVLYVAPSPYANGVTWKNLESRFMTGCMNTDTNPSNTGEPELGSNACSSVAKTYEDQILPFVDGVCFKILRKWTVIDWCKFSPNTDVNGAVYPGVPVLGVNMWSYTQTIAVSETEDPVIQNCTKADTETFADNCATFVELINTAVDCTPNDKLKWSYTIDLQNDGVGNVITGSTNNASRNFPVGTHSIHWTVEDMCGNQSTCSYLFRVIDKKKPTPYCLSEITTVIMPSVGQVELWAKDFDKGSYDNCPVTGCGLRFTFNGFRPPVASTEVLFDINGTVVGSWPTTNATLLDRYESGQYQRWLPSTCSSAKLYTCDDLGSNDERMSVWDASGNTDFCTVTLYIQANGTSCSGSRLAGNIGTENSKMVEKVTVLLTNMASQEFVIAKTDVNGYFEFNTVTPSTAFTVSPEKDVDPTNGVTTLDIVMIQRHILGISELGSPYKYKAADINNDSKITAADLVELRKLVLGVYSSFPSNKSWRFIDKSIDFTEFNDIYNAKEFIRLDSMHESMLQNNFVAVKVGDVNESATTAAASSNTENRSSEKLSLATVEQSFDKGEIVKVPVTADNFVEMVGAQWTLNFDANNLVFNNIESGALNLNDDNMHVKDGKIAFSWNSHEAQTYGNEEVLFTIEFEAIANSKLANSLSLSSDITRTEAYTSNLDEINIELMIRDVNVHEFTLGQNNPNPFASSTTISFTLPEDGDATLRILDITGKVLKTIQGQYLKGKNEVVLSADEFNAQGVMLYELESKGQKATKKMIYLHK